MVSRERSAALVTPLHSTQNWRLVVYRTPLTLRLTTHRDASSGAAFIPEFAIYYKQLLCYHHTNLVLSLSNTVALIVYVYDDLTITKAQAVRCRCIDAVDGLCRVRYG